MTTSNKVALITGAAKRIGKQTTTTLHNNGFNVIVHCNKSVEEAKSFVDELNTKRANSASWLSADLTSIDEVTELGNQAVAQFGRLDVLVNNASSFYPTDIDTATEQQWDDLFASNLKAPFFLAKTLKSELANNQGCIVNMVDIHADRPLLEYPIYCMAKAGLVMQTKSLSRELAPKIRVNGIAPGVILWHENELSENDKQNVVNEISLKRLGSPKDIAEAILFLCKADYVTGQILAVDGGRSIHGGEKA